ncbi:MAG: hypothetical protein V7K32_02300 [Nostoc sp.]
MPKINAAIAPRFFYICNSTLTFHLPLPHAALRTANATALQ